MKRTLASLVAAILLVSSFSAQAHDHRHRAHYRGDWWGPALGVGLVLGSAAIVANAYEPPRYRQPVVVMPAPVMAAPPAASVWYFCADTNSYYPSVPDCPSGWRVVPAQPAYAPPPPHY